MQFVLLDHLLAHRLKRAKTHVQGDLGRLDSTLMNVLKNFRREVQARRRRGDRTERLGVDRLVGLAVGGRVGAVDVRRQGNVADAIEHAEEVVDRIEAKMALAKGSAAHDLGREFMRRFIGLAAEINPLTQAELAAGMDQRFPLRRTAESCLVSSTSTRPRRKSFAAGFCVESGCAREPLRCPKRRAGNTLVLLKTSRSSGRSSWGKSRNTRSSRRSSLRRRCNSRERRPVGQRFLGDQFLRQAIVEIGNQHKAIMPERTYHHIP